jgi:hypothetical protein
VLDQQSFVDPIKDKKVQTANKVQSWHSAREEHQTPERGEVLGKHKESLDFRSSVQVFKVILQQFFSVNFLLTIIMTTLMNSISFVTI